jgi:hypothetical protein
VEQFVNENEKEEIIVLKSKEKPHTEKKNIRNKWIDRVLTILLIAGIFFLFIFTFENNYKTYWVYLVNFIVLPFIGLISVSINENKNNVLYAAKVIFRILVILLVILESIMQYNNHSIFSIIKHLLI